MLDLDQKTTPFELERSKIMRIELEAESIQPRERERSDKGRGKDWLTSHHSRVSLAKLSFLSKVESRSHKRQWEIGATLQSPFHSSFFHCLLLAVSPLSSNSSKSRPQPPSETLSEVVGRSSRRSQNQCFEKDKTKIWMKLPTIKPQRRPSEVWLWANIEALVMSAENLRS